jgi:hypothetical protein
VTPDREAADGPVLPAALRRAGHAVRDVLVFRPLMVLAIVLTGAAAVAASTTIAHILNPDLATMPPVVRRPAAPAPESTTPTPAEPTESPSPPPAPARSTRPPAPPPPPRTAAPPTGARPLSSGPLRLSYEAEAAQLSSQPRTRDLNGASGGRIVGYIGRYDESVRFNRVTVPGEGRYTLTVHYVSGEYRRFVIRVNDRRSSTITFEPTGPAWSTVGTRRFSVKLQAGRNTVTFGNVDGSWAPDLDRITVTD